MPHPAPDPARDAAERDAYDEWRQLAGGITGAPEDRDLRWAFYTGAAHGRAEADAERLAAWVARDAARMSERSVASDLATARADLRDARNEAESAREQARGENALRVEAERERDEARAETDSIMADYQDLAARMHLPSPPAALKERVVQDAVDFARSVKRADDSGEYEDMQSEMRAQDRLVAACAALDAATPKPSDAVAEARDAIARMLDGNELTRPVANREHNGDLRATLVATRALLDSALDAARAERKGGGA